MRTTYRPGERERSLVITSDQVEFTLDASQIPAKGSVLIEGEHRVRIPEGADLGFLTATDCDLVIEDAVSLNSLQARSLEAEGNLYPVFGMELTGDAWIAGRLIGERHNPYRIGGNLKADAVDVDGHVIVAGNLEADWIVARSLKLGGELKCPKVELEDQDMSLDEAASIEP